MANLVKTNKEVIYRGYIVVLAVIAFMAQVFIHDRVEGRLIDDWIAFGKMIPWTLCPMFICAVLGAYYTDLGYKRLVGTIGVLIMLAATIVQFGSMAWMGGLDIEDEVITAKLNGYELRLPIAIFLVASSFLRGGAVACLLSVLSDVRNSTRCREEVGAFASFAVLISVATFALMVMNVELEWGNIASISFIYLLMLIPAMLMILRNKQNDIANDDQVREYVSEKCTEHVPILSIMILVISLFSFASYFKFLPVHWRQSRIFWGRESIFALMVSAITFAVGLFLLRKNQKLREKVNGTLVGSIMLLVGFPLAAAIGEESLLILVPQIMNGFALSLIVSSTLPNVINIPCKWYSMTWVGITLAIIVLSYIMRKVLFNMADGLNTTSIAVYIIYPLIALVLIILSLWRRPPSELSSEIM